jgi:hypothetical protein
VTTPDGGLHIDWRVVARGTMAGLSLIVPIVIVIEVLDAVIDDFDSSGWLVFAFLLILFAFGAAGYAGGKLGPWAPYTHGILSALGALGITLLFRVIERLARGKDLGFGWRSAIADAMFAAGLGLFGAAIAGRAPQLLEERERRNHPDRRPPADSPGEPA